MPAANIVLAPAVTASIDLLCGVVMATVALIGGFLGDYFGRKKLAMAGFFLAALSYGIFSFSTGSLNVWLSYRLVNVTALGILYPLFLFTLWGDLSKKGSSEKYYTLGCLPFIISVALMYSVGTYLANFLQPSYMYAFVSLFLFAAILPIAYAKEIMPSLHRVQELNEKLKVISNLTRHDINNKLTTVNGQAYLLMMDNPENPEIVEHAKEIEQAVKDSIRIFEFAKIYENLGVEELSYVKVEEAINDAAALFPNWSFRIVNDCQNVIVLADSFLPQMFYNLLDNTRKYGEVTKTARFYYELEKECGIRLIYEDDGVGVSSENKPRLFKEGFSTGGSKGYGLFLIKKMVDGYGWTITEVGQPGKGAKFVICIPSNAVTIL
jgi:signal transduction histidine kinase